MIHAHARRNAPVSYTQGSQASVPPTMSLVSHVQIIHELAYGPDADQRLDIYWQGTRVGEPRFFDVANDARPLLFWIHGGGWLRGDKAAQWHQAVPFLEAGWHVANINYRQGPGTAPLAVDDCLAALDFVRQRAASDGADIERVVVAGASAGGHLALTTGIRDGNVAAIVNWYGITDIAAVAAYLDSARPGSNYARTWIGGGDVDAISAAHSPIHLLGDGTPPILTIHGDADTVVPTEQAHALDARIRELGLKGELEIVPGGNHGGFTGAQYDAVFARIFEFLATISP